MSAPDYTAAKRVAIYIESRIPGGSSRRTFKGDFRAGRCPVCRDDGLVIRHGAEAWFCSNCGISGTTLVQLHEQLLRAGGETGLTREVVKRDLELRLRKQEQRAPAVCWWSTR